MCYIFATIYDFMLKFDTFLVLYGVYNASGDAKAVVYILITHIQVALNPAH